MDETIPSAAEKSAAAALRASVAVNQGQQTLTEESRQLLTSFLRGELRDELRIAVAEGISAAMTEDAAERFWNKGFEVLQKQATVRTGRFVLGGLTAVAKKALWVVVFVGLAYSFGGWNLVKTVWAAVAPKG